MMKKLQVLIALVLFVLCAVAPYAAVQGTSITSTVQLQSNSVGEGIRVGTWQDGGKLGSYAFPVFRQQWDAPAARSSNTLANNMKWDDELTTDCTGFSLTTLADARTIAMWVNFTDSTDYSTESVNTSITLTGTDIHGYAISETLDCEKTSPAIYIGDTKKAFKTLTAVTWLEPIMGGGAGDEYSSLSVTFDIGYGKAFGLKWRMLEDTRVCELIDADGSGGAVDVGTAGTIVLGSHTTTVSSGDWRGTITYNDVPDGTSDYVLYYIPTDVLQRWPEEPAPAAYGRDGP